ncbi:hypothetical protein BO86DRAFT_407580 [Aspergillus japonicus CBS 114.51]|uniref:Uncharacterized protein n=1 Tax=Aspergillus japonicus CBS 114.51 TaxID=1448312 RepID=A0A8T8X8W9_ASPJA|nr:hypothetical protein BO86DRAFT_407580 [Aspergillus japonicus CBS 114.51]RAH84623.1 hypothetical protein BO86DRAFT_407580 [Aspergillus japonicus CBS 114.51]
MPTSSWRASPPPEPPLPRHWPGGIPSTIRNHATHIHNHGRLLDITRGWFLFVSERWISRKDAGVAEHEDVEYELRQRRTLVEQWAAANQSFRDAFQARAPRPASPRDYCPEARKGVGRTRQPQSQFLCLADVQAHNVLNRARWVKLLILLQDFNTPAGNGSICHQPLILDPNPTTDTQALPLSKADALRWLFLETADFEWITMAVDGTVLFLKRSDYWIWHGKKEKVAQLENFFIGMPGDFHKRIPHMNLSLLEILNTAWDQHLMRGFWPEAKTEFAKKVDEYAPGYRELEARHFAASGQFAALGNQLAD